MARHGLLVMTYDELFQASCASDPRAQRVCNSPAGTVQLEHPDSLREMPAATEPAPAAVDYLKQRKRLPIDGDWVWDELPEMGAAGSCKPIAVACTADPALGGIVEFVPAAGVPPRRLSRATTLPNGGGRLVQFAVSFCKGSVFAGANWVVGPVRGSRVQSRRHGLEAIEGLNEARV